MTTLSDPRRRAQGLADCGVRTLFSLVWSVYLERVDWLDVLMLAWRPQRACLSGRARPAHAVSASEQWGRLHRDRRSSSSS